MFGIQESVLLREIQKHIRKNKDEEHKRRERERERQQRLNDSLPQSPAPPNGDAGTAPQQPASGEASQPPQPAHGGEGTTATAQPVLRRTPATPLRSAAQQERDVIRYVTKFGMCYLCDTDYEDQQQAPTTVLEYIHSELEIDQIHFTVPIYKKIFTLSLAMVPVFYDDLAACQQEMQAWSDREFRDRLNRLNPTGLTSEELQKKEEEIRASVIEQSQRRIDEFRQNYLEKRLCSHHDDDVREVTCDLVSDKHQLSKIYTQNAYVATEFDRLLSLVPKAIHNWKNTLVAEQIKELQKQMAGKPSDESAELLRRLQELFRVRSELAKLIGDRVVNPK